MVQNEFMLCFNAHVLKKPNTATPIQGTYQIAFYWIIKIIFSQYIVKE